MLRIIKYFDMPLPGVAVQRLAFTADPGAYSKPEQWIELRTLESQLVSAILLSNFPFVHRLGVPSHLPAALGLG